MEKRAMIAVAIAFAILIIYQVFFIKPVPQPETIQKQVEKDAKGESVTKEEAVTLPLVPKIKTILTEEKEIKINTELYAAVFTTRGATVKYYELKKHKDKQGKNVVLLKKPGIQSPLSIGSKDEFELATSNFNVTGKDLTLDNYNKTGSLIFKYSDVGYSIKRSYTFYFDSYRIDIRDEVVGLPDYWITIGSDFGILNAKDMSTHVGPVLLQGTDRVEFDTRKLDTAKSYTEGLKWIAQEDKYFFASLVPLTPIKEAKVWRTKDKSLAALRAKPGVNKFLLYAGPKEYDRLKVLNVGLEHIIDFGFFSIIALPLFWVMKLFYKITMNYGWAIIFLTVLIRIPFIPLMNKMQKSMKKMQAIQPKMAELREKYKKDPQRLQKEMMQLYKTHKVNPLGGCLPILLQLPVFFALYKILSIAAELRGAPFMLWINDLSAPDTLFGHIPSWFPLIGGFAVGPLPILMGASMIIQQKMTPTTMDPTQNKLMMFMPVIFTFLFLNFASGLVLYWLMNNVFSIAQQFYVNRKLAKEAK